MQRNITTIEELKKEKKKLRVSIELTREALNESFDINQVQAKRFFVENIALPASVFGIGTFAVKQLTKKDKAQIEKMDKKKFDFKPIIKKLLPIAINMFNVYLLEKRNEKMELQHTGETTEKAISPKLKSVS